MSIANGLTTTKNIAGLTLCVFLSTLLPEVRAEESPPLERSLRISEIPIQEDLYWPTAFANTDRAGRKTIPGDARVHIEASIPSDSKWTIAGTTQDNRTVMILFKNADERFVPITAELIDRPASKDHGMIVLSKTSDETLKRFAILDNKVKRLKRDVITDMKALASLRKTLDFNEPSPIYETIFKKVTENVGTITDEDTNLLITALRELMEALSDDLKEDLRIEKGKIAEANKGLAEIHKFSLSLASRWVNRVNGIRNLPLTPEQQEMREKRYMITITLKGLRTRSQRAVARLPKMYEVRVSVLKKRFDNYESLLSDYAELVKLDKERQEIIDSLAALDEEDIVLTVSLVSQGKALPVFLPPLSTVQK